MIIRQEQMSLSSSLEDSLTCRPAASLTHGQDHSRPHKSSIKAVKEHPAASMAVHCTRAGWAGRRDESSKSSLSECGKVRLVRDACLSFHGHMAMPGSTTHHFQTRRGSCAQSTPNGSGDGRSSAAIDASLHTRTRATPTRTLGGACMHTRTHSTTQAIKRCTCCALAPPTTHRSPASHLEEVVLLPCALASASHSLAHVHSHSL